MIGNKAVLTYKRKRFSSRPGLGFENDCADQSHGCQTSEILEVQVKEEDPKHVSETKDPEHLEVEKPFSSCVKRQDHLCSLQTQASNDRKENTLTGESDTRQIHSDLHTKALQTCGNNSLQSNAEKPLSTDVSTKDMPGSPLITFSRRLRHKKTVDGTGIEDRPIVMDKFNLMVAERSNSTMDNGVLLDVSSDFTGNDPSPRYCPANQEKKTREDVDLHEVHSFSVPKIEISEMLADEVLKDTPSITEPASILPILKDKQPEASECHVSAVDGSWIVSCDRLEKAKVSTDKIRDGGSVAPFDLSKPPPGSSGLVDCNLTLESSSNVQPDNNVSETRRDSTESTSRSHSIAFHEFPPRGRVLELLDERIGEASLSQVPYVPARLSSSGNMRGVDHPSVVMGQPQTSKKNFLQLFPEDRSMDALPFKKASQETSFIIHPEDRRSMLTSNRKLLHFRGSTNPTASPLPTESRNSRGPSLSFWPNFNTNTQQHIQDTSGAHYPSDSASLMRHKMMLDNIISKARAVSASGKKHSSSDHFDFPRMWSEEELDFLWMGVRRHGIGNWDAMLRDNRLHFATWRSPKELGERWEEEQLKLLNTKPPSQTKQFSKKHSEEPQLSLGLYNGKHGATCTKGKLQLPHWLQEVRPVKQTTGMMQWMNQPFLAGMLTGTSGQRNGRNETGGNADDVIDIKSDASSEETISDRS